MSFVALAIVDVTIGSMAAESTASTSQTQAVTPVPNTLDRRKVLADLDAIFAGKASARLAAK
jgi:hypothetical protein